MITKETLLETFKDVMLAHTKQASDAILSIEETQGDKGLRDPSNPIVRAMQVLDYSLGKDYVGPSTKDYETPMLEHYYLMRYGMAYAFEYWLMYDAILRDHAGKRRYLLEVASLGCGTLLDAWSLAYAKAKIEEEIKDFPECVDFQYFGFDQARWAYHMAGYEDNANRQMRSVVNPCYYLKMMDSSVYLAPCTFNKDNLLNFFKNYKDYFKNIHVFMFGKILNELSANNFNTLLRYIEKASENGEIQRERFYICISHSPSYFKASLNAGQDLGWRLVQAFNANGAYQVTKDVMKKSCLYGKGLCEAAEGEGVYKFGKNESDVMEIDALNPDFDLTTVRKIQKEFTHLDEKHRNPISRTSFLLDQVFKLERKRDS